MPTSRPNGGWLVARFGSDFKETSSTGEQRLAGVNFIYIINTASFKNYGIIYSVLYVPEHLVPIITY